MGRLWTREVAVHALDSAVAVVLTTLAGPRHRRRLEAQTGRATGARTASYIVNN